MTAPHKYTEFMRLLNEQRAAELRTINEGQRLGLKGTLKKLNDICYETGRIVNDVLTKMESEVIGAELDAGDPRIFSPSAPAMFANAQAANVTAAGIKAVRDLMMSHGGTLFPIPTLNVAELYPLTISPPSSIAKISTIETLPALSDETCSFCGYAMDDRCESPPADYCDKAISAWQAVQARSAAARDEKINEPSPTPPPEGAAE